MNNEYIGYTVSAFSTLSTLHILHYTSVDKFCRLSESFEIYWGIGLCKYT